MEYQYLLVFLWGCIPLLGWLLLKNWYFRLINQYQNQVHHHEGYTVPAREPKLLLGNMTDVYQSDNMLAAYDQFHEQFGEIVQIYWMWKQQISVSNFKMVEHILVSHQHNYQKFPPNQLIQKLYGTSVLTTHGIEWKRQRTLVQSVFLPQQIVRFHDLFFKSTIQLVKNWQHKLGDSSDIARHNVYPDLMSLFLDIIGQTAFGANLGEQIGEVDEVIASIRFILNQSTRPLYQFTSWWQHLPLPNNYRLHKAFTKIDNFLDRLIQERRSRLHPASSNTKNLLDLLLQATEWVDEDFSPFTNKEVRDNLLAITINGFESVATSTAFSLELLARHPDQMELVLEEVDNVFSKDQFTPSDLLQLPYLKAVVVESLRLRPPMAGIQRISVKSDNLENWSIPEQQVVGIPLRPLHLDPKEYGENPGQFCPQRYAGGTSNPHNTQNKGCPIKRFLGHNPSNSLRFPLAFGDGARQCLGSTFALHEMTIVLGTLLHHFSFSIQPGDEAVMELGKFGLFISMLPKDGVNLQICSRSIDV